MLRRAQVSDAIESGVKQKLADGHNLYLLVKNGKGFWVYRLRDGAVIRNQPEVLFSTKSFCSARDLGVTKSWRNAQGNTLVCQGGQPQNGANNHADRTQLARAVQSHCSRNSPFCKIRALAGCRWTQPRRHKAGTRRIR